MKIAIVGYGTEGRSLYTYFTARGDEVTVCDVKEPAGLKPQEKKNFRCGPGYLDSLDEFEAIFRSPGVAYLKKEFGPVRTKLTSLTRYFFTHCPCPIIGVTGTKGKGTTTSLIYEMIQQWGKKRVYIGGNIGRSPLEFLDQLTADDCVVLELSSFQLQDLDTSPHIAVVLGITPDHMDYHATFKEYVEAKKNIVRFQSAKDIAVLDADNELSRECAAATKAAVHMISRQETVTRGAFVKVGSFLIKKGRTGILFGKKGETGLLGAHNITNILAAATAATAMGVPVEVITRVTRHFRPLPHRLEFVREVAGVKFYNDSASTNPQTTVAALRSFENPLLLIVGGSDKNTDFTPLGREIVERLNVRRVILMGETRGKIEAAIDQAIAKSKNPLRRKDAPLELISAETYQEAFMVARLLAQPGDTVLLSPACASFDMFSNYQERGEIFKNFIDQVA